MDWRSGLAVLAISAALGVPALSHAAASKAAAKPAARGPASTKAAAPDFSGTWNRYPDLLIAPFLPNQPKAGDPLATPTGTLPPLKAQYKRPWEAHTKQLRDAAARNQPIAARQVECIPDGMPNMMRGAWIMEILQTPKQINISQELYNQTRRVYMNQMLPPLDELDPGYYGRSVGHFEGDTLVIETIGTRTTVMATSVGGPDVPHSPDMKMVERIHYVAPNIIHVELTMTDPAVLEKPWTVITAYQRLPDYKIQEYICEANRTHIDENGVQRRTDADIPNSTAK